MADALEGIRKWTGSVSAGLALAIVIGGWTMYGDVQSNAIHVEAVTLLAQATETRTQTLERSVAGVDAKLDSLRHDMDKIGDSVDQQAKEASTDRALILQELGRLQGKTESSPPRR